MTESDLRDRLHTHVGQDEPAALTDPTSVISRGQRRVRSRRLVAGVAAVAVIAVGGVVAGTVYDLSGPSGTSPDRIDPAVQKALDNYDAATMPQLLEERAQHYLGDALDGLGDPEFYAGDGQGQKIGPANWDKASSMDLSYAAPERQLRVALYHARGEVEGDVDEICADDLRSGYELVCQVGSHDGQPVITKVSAARREDPSLSAGDGLTASAWLAVTKGELERQRYLKSATMNGETFDPDNIWFMRTVEVIKSDTFGTSITEYVHAPDLATAQERFAASADELAGLAADPTLLLPTPPPDPASGCDQWLKPGSQVTCTG